ncbi:MAG: AlpA family phage regulatory protein [Desulfobulbaceae bacterium]|nr:AlpA family phage regulatory protein [Desulfobulbaceae bacterium]
MNATLEELAVLRLPEVIRLTGLCRSSIYEMMNKGLFPNSITLGHRAVGWVVRDVRSWLEARMKGGGM